MLSTNVFYNRWTSVRALSWSLGVLIWTNINVLYTCRKLTLTFGFYKLVSSWEELPHSIFTFPKHLSLKKGHCALFEDIWKLFSQRFFVSSLNTICSEEEQVYNNDNDDDDKISIKISHLTIRSKNVGQKCVLFLMKITSIIQLIISILSKTYLYNFVQSSDYCNH